VRFQHLARVTVTAAVIAVTAAGCNSSTGGSSSASGDKCKLNIGFFGAKTGASAGLGKAIHQGIQLAVDEYNKKHADCKVGIKDYDSQGAPEQAPALAQQAINDKTVIGIVGPAFSGESKAADPSFNEAGLSLISPSATNPKLSTNGWKVFHRILGNDATQGPAAAAYIKNVLKASKVAVVDDGSEYGAGLAAIVKQSLGSQVVATDTVATKQTDFGPTVTKIKSSGAKVFFYGGYYPEAGLLRKQLSEAGGQDITMVSADGVKDDGYMKAAGSSADGTILTCPCLPPSKTTGTFAADYKAAFGEDAGTYSAESFDSAQVFLDGIAAGKTSRSAMNDWVNSYDKDGVSKHIKFDSTGEVSDKKVWAYKVTGGKIVEDQEVQTQ
jgi:branched-chain amino acid transport system substrate-binding protein